MYGCEIFWSTDDAQRVQDLVEESTGQPCPCKQGKACPIVGDRFAAPIPIAIAPSTAVAVVPKRAS